MEHLRQTKIIATLGPASDTREAVKELIDAGTDIFRINMSHAKHDWAKRVEGYIREAAVVSGKTIAVLADLQGPAIRTGTVSEPFQLQEGQPFTFTTDDSEPSSDSVSVNYPGLADDVSPGDTILIDNGLIRMKVIAEKSGVIECEVVIGGEMGSRRHINLPGVKVNLPALTEKDRVDVAFALEIGVDFIALSFVREAKDIAELRDTVAGVTRPPSLIAKIEDQHAVKNLDSIIAAADAIMIARGDLGIECPYEELPIIQRRIAKLCQQCGRPVVVATQMLESMIEKPHPTRAEVTDVANAVYEQVDAIMLSGEISIGKYPKTCVEVADRIACRIERSGGANFQKTAQLEDPREKLARAAVRMANDLQAQAIVVFTKKGRMVDLAAWMRPRQALIYAICPDEITAGSQAIFRAVCPIVLPLDYSNPSQSMDEALLHLVNNGCLVKDDRVVLISSVAAVEDISDSVQMRVID